MDKSGPLYDLTVCHPAKESLVHIEWGVWWSPVAVWLLEKRNKFRRFRLSNSDRPLSRYFSHILKTVIINPLNAELNPICHLLALLGGATIVVLSRLRVNHLLRHAVQRFVSASTAFGLSHDDCSFGRSWNNRDVLLDTPVAGSPE